MEQYGEDFSKNFVYNQSYLANYYKNYNPFVENFALVIGLLTVLAIYLVIGPIGNIAIIGAVCTNKLLWKPLNLFIINLSLADLVEVTIITSTSIVGLTMGHQVFLQNHRLCNIVANICVTSCFVSVFTHVTIAVTRYILIRHHYSILIRTTWGTAICTCIVIWFVAFLLQMGPDVGWGRNVFDLKQMICVWDRTYSLGYTLYIAIVFVFIPVITIFISYIKLFLYVRKVHYQVESNELSVVGLSNNIAAFNSYGPKLSKRRWKQEYKLAKTLFAHFALVLILWGQYILIVIGDIHNRLPTKMYAISVQIAHSIAVLNIFIYLSNSCFRKGMKAFLTGKPLQLVPGTVPSMDFSYSRVRELRAPVQNNISVTFHEQETIFHNYTKTYCMKHYEVFRRNYVYNQTFLSNYYRDYNPFIQNRRLIIGLLTLLAIYLLIGPLGNIAIIGAIYTNKLLWKPLNAFIINLSLADLVEVTIITSTSIVGLTIGHQVFLQNHQFCNIVANVCVTSCVVSLLTHMTIAITRYLSIRYHNSFVNRATWPMVVSLCVFIWIAAFFLQIGPNVGWGRNVYDLKQMICIWDRTYSLGYTLYFAIVFVFLPVSTIFFCYIQLFRHVRKIHNEVEANEMAYHNALANNKDTLKNRASMSKRRWKQEYRLAKTLFAHFAMVFVLWGQYAFIVICDYQNKLPMKLHASSIQIAHAIAVLNVFIYLSNPSFRAGMIAFITRKPIKMVLAGMGTTAQYDYSQTRHTHSHIRVITPSSKGLRNSENEMVVDRCDSSLKTLQSNFVDLSASAFATKTKGKSLTSKDEIIDKSASEKIIVEPYVPDVPFDDDIYIGPAPPVKE